MITSRRALYFGFIFKKSSSGYFYIGNVSENYFPGTISWLLFDIPLPYIAIDMRGSSKFLEGAQLFV